ncbi:hypothetical protein DVH24_035966 [Malus domestica]|uniref:Uncharacterized protein n=1 Tax=Malus domestica TaxID=3750 RepID=A0A498JNH4_MALDO|nr:hypothetical protein DVH24_035966 [Malus domestica]
MARNNSKIPMLSRLETTHFPLNGILVVKLQIFNAMRRLQRGDGEDEEEGCEGGGEMQRRGMRKTAAGREKRYCFRVCNDLDGVEQPVPGGRRGTKKHPNSVPWNSAFHPFLAYQTRDGTLRPVPSRPVPRTKRTHSAHGQMAKVARKCILKHFGAVLGLEWIAYE